MIIQAFVRVALCLTLTSIVFAQTRIAIPPFENITKNTEFDWLSTGLSETLISGLGEVRSITIIERTQLNAIIQEQDLQLSDMSDATKAVAVGQVSGAQKMLLGSYQVFGERIKVSARIVDVASGEVDKAHVIAAEESLNKIFDLYNVIVEKALNGFKVAASKEEMAKIAASTKGTTNLEAYENYIKGLLVYATSGSKKEYEQAITMFDKALQIDPNYAIAHTGLAKSWAKIGRLHEINFEFDEKIAAYQNAAKSASSAIKGNKNLSTAWTSLALIYRELKQRDRLINAAAKAIELKPSEFEAYDFLADAYTAKFFPQNANIDSAIYYRAKAVEIEPTFAAGFRGLGSDYLEKGSLNEAEQAFKKAVELNPRHGGGHDLLGQVYFRLGKFDEAKAEFNQKIALDPKSAFGYAHLGDLLYAQGLYSEAFLKFTYAIEITPSAAYAYNSLAWMHLTAREQRFRNYGKAVEYAANAIGYTNFKNAAYLFVAAESYYAASHSNVNLRDTAITYIKMALQIESTNIEYQDALSRYMAREKSSEHVYAVKRAEFFVRCNKLSEALEELSTAQKANSDYIPVYLAFANVYARQGEKNKALDRLEQARKLDKSGMYAKAIETSMNAIKR